MNDRTLVIRWNNSGCSVQLDGRDCYLPFDVRPDDREHVERALIRAYQAGKTARSAEITELLK